MAWSNSKVFGALIEDCLQNTQAHDVSGGTPKAALYDNTITPDETVTSANTAYAVGQWVVAGEVDDGTNWDTGGEPITSTTHARSGAAGSHVFTFDGADTPQGGASTTLASVFGCLVYDDAQTTPVANAGYCYNYFGGSNGVTGGTFTIVWNASGIFSVSF